MIQNRKTVSNTKSLCLLISFRHFLKNDFNHVLDMTLSGFYIEHCKKKCKLSSFVFIYFTFQISKVIYDGCKTFEVRRIENSLLKQIHWK